MPNALVVPWSPESLQLLTNSDFITDFNTECRRAVGNEVLVPLLVSVVPERRRENDRCQLSSRLCNRSSRNYSLGDCKIWENTGRGKVSCVQLDSCPTPSRNKTADSPKFKYSRRMTMVLCILVETTRPERIRPRIETCPTQGSFLSM